MNIIIFGFPHSGTSILKSIIGHHPEIHEIIEETNKGSPCKPCKTTKQHCVLKTPYWHSVVNNKSCKNYMQVMVLRNPVYTFSSLNKRYKFKIRKDLTLPNYIKALSIYDSIIPDNMHHKFLYKDMFENNHMVIKHIFKSMGLKINQNIFDNTSYVNRIIENQTTPQTKPSHTNHEAYRTYQINQLFKNMNNIDKIDLTHNQITFIKNNRLINKYFPENQSILSRL